MKLKAVFLDKDGELIPEIPNDRNSDLSEINESFVEALQLLQSHGYLLVIVSNHSGNSESMQTDEARYKKGIAQSCLNMGIYLDGFYTVPANTPLPGNEQNGIESSDSAAGLLKKAAGDMEIDLSKSWIVGDLLNDVKAGNQAGCNTLLVTNGTTPDIASGSAKLMAKDLAEAARKIVSTPADGIDKKQKKKAVMASA